MKAALWARFYMLLEHIFQHSCLVSVSSMAGCLLSSASTTEMEHSIFMSGSAGSGAIARSDPGGGSGGLVHYISLACNPGSGSHFLDRRVGRSGSAAGSVREALYSGGGAGGALGGSGGRGGSVLTNQAFAIRQNGAEGRV
jgi:hypothetical protein